MKICPIAIAVGCAKCPVFKVCPVKGVIGDAAPADEKPAGKSAAAKKSAAKKK